MNTHIHRLLDDAFEGVETTAESRELKEEVRTNLMARSAELEASGLTSASAAQQAIDELGPIEDLLGTSGRSEAMSMAELHARNKVRPQPGFVVRTTLLSVGAAVATTLAVLAGFDVLSGGSAAVLGLGLAAAAMLGFVTADSLRQETSTNYPMPTARAVGYGLATFGVLASAASFAAFAADTGRVVLAIVGGVLLLAALGLFSWLGATQTNRHKQWVRTTTAGSGNRFERDEDAAARYGIYSGVIWVAGIGVGIALSILFAWWWSLVVLGVCIVASMLLLATMLFGSKAKANN